jgi:hypothetical protein
MFTVYKLITREFCFAEEFYPHELDASKIQRKRKWTKHPDTKLDRPVEEYRRVLDEWVARRTEADKVVDHFTKASKPLSWPKLIVDAEPYNETGWIRACETDQLRKLGKDVLEWQRPPVRFLRLEEGQRLLATGWASGASAPAIMWAGLIYNPNPCNLK